MSLITVDPGLTGTGVAVWDANGKLLYARAVGCGDGALTERAAHIVEKVRPYVTKGAPRPRRMVIEQPQTYRGRAAKGDANSLLSLSMLVGGLATLSPTVELVLPRVWKGNMPASIVEMRGREALQLSEVLNVDLECSKKHQTDVWSAVGIGLWWLRRQRLR